MRNERDSLLLNAYCVQDTFHCCAQSLLCKPMKQAVLVLVWRWPQEGSEKATHWPKATELSKFQNPFH